MIFYDCSTAPNPRRARMFIAEKGLTVDTREISIADKAQLAPEFLAVNPRGTVPVLQTDDGTILSENLGIAAYLEALHPEPPLMGRTPEEKGAVLMWNAICEQQGGWPIAEAFRNSNPHMKGRAVPGRFDHDQIPELAERGLARAQAFFDMLEEHMAGREFIATDHFTLADITAFCFVSFARVVKLRIPEGNAASQAWFERVKGRPSAAL